MDDMSVREAAARWGISDRRVRALCAEGKIEGVAQSGRAYRIPADAVKPADGRGMRGIEIAPKDRPLFARVDALKGRLEKLRPLTRGELSRLRDEFLVEFTYNSNAIEGNSLTLRETALVLEGVAIGQKPLRDHLEAVGNRDAFKYAERLVSERTPFSERIVRELHALVLMDRPEDRGVYRSIPVRIMGAANVPPEPYLVKERMESLVAEHGKSRLHPIERAARFHLEFEGIHPFVDGNGRTGRLILNLMLMQGGYPPINVKFADRGRYSDCFEEYFSGGTPARLLRLICDSLTEELERFLGILS